VTDFSDVNTAAGQLRDVFAVDLTTATGRCAGCGQTAPLAQAKLYGPAPGVVMRCRSCDTVLMRMVTAPGRAWLDLSGLSFVEIVTA
jgi:hypothetical protein